MKMLSLNSVPPFLFAFSIFPLLMILLVPICYSQQVGAPARVGLVAPIDVVVPPGNTGLDPSQTSFFQVFINRFRYFIILITISSPAVRC